MNSYFLSISGWWWLLVLFCLIAVALTIFTYKNTIPPIAKSKKILLISIRSIALVILFFSIFEPIYTSIKTLITKPQLVVLVDNSVSMVVDDAAGNRKERALNVFKKLDLSPINPNIIYYSFGEDVRMIDTFYADSLQFNENSTDISKAIRTINNISEATNTRAILLITDGVFNTGNNPLFDAENFAKPIYTIGIGDTVEPKDISIKSLLVNEIAYIENPIPVTINFSSVGFSNVEAKVSLLDDGKKIAEQVVNLHSDRTNYTLIFEYNPVKEGIRKLTATISELENEITNKNNTHSEYVKVLKNSRKVVMFAGSPSPDFSFIKRELDNEKGLEIVTYIQKKGAEFYTQPSQQVISSADVIIFCGFPINSTPNNILSMIKTELDKGKSFMFVAGLTTDYNKLKILENNIPFQVVSSKPNEFMVSPLINVDALANPILRVTGTDEDISLWNRLPPIFRTETFVKINPESEVLSTMKINNVEFKEPLLITREFQNNKQVAIMGYGLYRWKMLGYASSEAVGKTDVPDLFEILIDNSYRWLSVKERSKLVNIRTTKKHFNQGEKIEFIGDLYDASYIPIENANIKIDIGANENKREISMTSIGNGRYIGSVEGLSQGDFNFIANATLGSRNLGNDNGRFSIGELAIEYQNLKQNASLLKLISDRTLGKYYDGTDLSTVSDDIMNSNSFTDRPVSLHSEFLLWNWLGLLIIAILLFATEWFIRKRSGLI
ncbi:MAG: VWA domain-containing protein [Bacteroidetes bacterium]|nr:VWA domain-containing protein [Bacteroidota bacterium]